MIKKITAILLTTAMLAGLLCACGDSTEEPVTKSADSVTQPISETAQAKLVYSKNDSLNPFEAETSVNIRLMGLLYDGLFTLDAAYNAKPVVATGCAEGAETLNVTLNTGVKFSDGSAVTAADVIYSFEQAKESVAYGERLRGFGTASTTNAYNIIFHLEEPDTFAKNCLTFPIVKKNSDEEMPLGTGRYVIEKGSKLLLKKNQYRKGFTPNMTCIELTEIKDPSAVGSSLEIGNTCFSFDELTEGSYTRVNASTVDVLLNNLVYLGINGDNEYLNSPLIRRAINSALNRQNIVTTAYQGHAKAAYTPFNPDWHRIAGSVDEVVTESLTIEELLSQSGLDLNGRRFSLLVNGDNAFKRETAKMIAGDLSAIGIETVVNILDYESYMEAVRNDGYDMYLGEIRLTANMDISDLFYGGSCDYGMTKAAQEQSFERYTQLRRGDCELMDFINTFAQEYPFIPVCYRAAIGAYTNALERGGAACCDGDVYCNIETWKIVKK